MIYEEEELQNHLSSQFFVWNSNVTRILHKRISRSKHESKEDSKRRRRAPVSIPKNRKSNFSSQPWGVLLTKLKAIPGGVSIGSRAGKLFRRRFRVPWLVYLDLVQKCRDKKLFGEKSLDKVDLCGSEICPIEIKLLGVLRILGRNWCFDDIAEATGMGESTVRKSFIAFTENFVQEYYDTYILRPIGADLQKMMDVFAKMGLPGCVGSTDCVHVKWDR